MPRVSVVMSVYNNAATVRSAVQCIIGQTFGDFEFIIIDDGSTDRSHARLQALAVADSRIRLRSRPNTGLTVALNEGLSLATGELIARMDGDDLCHPQRLQKQVAYFDANPDCVLLGTQIETIDPLGVVFERPTFPLDHADIERELLRANGWVICHPVSMMRAAAVARVGGYRNELNIVEDLDLFLRLAEVGRLANLPEVLLQYRQTLGSVVKRHFDKQLSLRESVIRDAYRRRGRAPPEPLDLVPRTLLGRDEQLRRWGWHALKHNQLAAARVHAWELLRLKPTDRESWRLLACAVRGR